MIGATGLRRPRGAEAPGPVPLLRLGGARKAGRCALGRRAPQAQPRDRRREEAARTCSSSTSPPPTWISRAARRSRPRSRHFRARCCSVSHDRALLDAVSGRLLAIEEGRLVSYPGGWADYRRAPVEQQSAPPERPAKQRERGRQAPRPAAPDPLTLLEREIARTEGRLAELERQLAEDWANVDLVGAHGAARRELSTLLARWELLFQETEKA